MSALIENPMVSGLGRYYARQDRRDSLAESAFTSLRDELIHALMHDPAQVVRTPGYKPREHTAADVINDSFAGQTGEQALHELLRIVGLCASGQADAEVHLRASAWIAARAREHAEFHQGDLLAELEGDEE